MNQGVTDPFWAEEVERARHQSPEEKLLLGADLFDYACEITLAGIRWQNPRISDEQALEILRQRLQLAERIEEHASSTIRTTCFQRSTAGSMPPCK